jgi:hypothetical protein
MNTDAIVKEYIENGYKFRFIHTVEHLIRMEFPNIKNLEVYDGGLRFEDDGIHTQEMVESFLNQFRNQQP